MLLSKSESFRFSTAVLIFSIVARKQLNILISIESFSTRQLFRSSKFASLENASKHVIGIQKIVSLLYIVRVVEKSTIYMCLWSMKVEIFPFQPMRIISHSLVHPDNNC